MRGIIAGLNQSYLDRPEPRAMLGSHVLIQGRHCSRTGQLTDLLVHVVGPRAGVVSDPNAEVLDFERLLLSYLLSWPSRSYALKKLKMGG